MCGIAGIIGLREEEVGEKINRMVRMLEHRGPDNEGVYVNGKIALGHKRLSIIDLSESGKQPMMSNDQQLVIVFNGEIYNFKEIRKELHDYSFKTETDTETILAAYKKWDLDFVHRLNGMFSMGIVDYKAYNIYLIRDRLGIKPLYFYHNNGVLAFASEMRSLLESDLIPRKVDISSVIDYMSYQTVHAPKTIVKGVSMLMPGQVMKADLSGDSYDIFNYWNQVVDSRRTNADTSLDDVRANVKGLLRNAVDKRMISDVPIGAFLSGGIDSTAVVGLMSQNKESSVSTFSVVFDDPKYSEVKYSRFVAKKFKTDHHELNLDPNTFMEGLPEVLDQMDHPSGDGPNSYFVSKLTKEAGITVALSGLGGDELFCGYPIFKSGYTLSKNKWVWRVPKVLRKIPGAINQVVRPGITSKKLSKVLSLDRIDLESYYPISRMVILDSLNLLVDVPDHKNRVKEIITSLPSFDSENHILADITNVEINTYLQNTLLRDTDQMSMASSLEVRVPFLDHELVEYVIGLPDSFKNLSSQKKLLVDSLGPELLPDQIVDREKMGFVFPWESWMKNELKSFCETNLTSLCKRSYINGEEVMRRWNSFLSGDKAVGWSRIWPLVVLGHWLQKNEIE